MIPAERISYAIGLPPTDAIAFLQGKVAQVTGSYTEMLDGQHARAFTVANVAKLDVLQDIQSSLTKALKDGLTLEQWKKGLIPDLQRKGWWQRDAGTAQLQAAGRVDAEGVIAKGLTPSRLKTIYQTNMQSAYMAGRYTQMMEHVDERPWWQYVAILDGRTRPAHRALHGKVFRYDDKAWGAVYPPNGYKCRCRVRAFSQLDIERRGIATSSSEGKLDTVQTQLQGDRTAIVTRLTDRSLPGGKFQPDPGFSNNPGQAVWQPGLEAADVQLSRRYVDTAVQGPAFGRFVDGQAEGIFPVAILRPADQARLRSDSAVAYMSSQTVAKQRLRHPELTVDDYRRIPEIIDTGEAYVQGDNRLVFLFEDAVVYRLALKANARRNELYMIHMIRTTREKAQREIRERLQANG